MKDSSVIDAFNSRLWLRWAMTNFVGFTVAWGIHSPLVHGLTGDHDDYLTLAQFVAHTAGLIKAGAVIALFQKASFVASRPRLIEWCGRPSPLCL